MRRVASRPPAAPAMSREEIAAIRGEHYKRTRSFKKPGDATVGPASESEIGQVSTLPQVDAPIPQSARVEDPQVGQASDEPQVDGNVDKTPAPKGPNPVGQTSDKPQVDAAPGAGGVEKVVSVGDKAAQEQPSGEHRQTVDDRGGDGAAAANIKAGDATVGPKTATTEVAIPDGWKKLAWPKKRKLAASISGGEVTTLVQADKIVADEVARRSKK